MILNKSGLKPVGHAVLVRHYKPAIKTTMIIVPEQVAAREKLADQRVQVLEIGPEAWTEEKAPRAVVGDRVLIQRFSGALAEGKDGKQYRIINDRDIFCVIEGDDEENSNG